MVVFDNDRLTVWDTSYFVQCYTWSYHADEELKCAKYLFSTSMFIFMPGKGNAENEKLTILNLVHNLHIPGYKGQLLRQAHQGLYEKLYTVEEDDEVDIRMVAE